MRDRERATAISLVLLVLLAIFAIHLMAHVLGVYARLGWLGT